MTVEEAFDRIRAIGVEKETVYTCYVTDSRRKLKGIVTVKDLLLAPKNELIRQYHGNEHYLRFHPYR